jgi:hypothetical protein
VLSERSRSGSNHAPTPQTSFGPVAATALKNSATPGSPGAVATMDHPVPSQNSEKTRYSPVDPAQVYPTAQSVEVPGTTDAPNRCVSPTGGGALGLATSDHP